MRPFAARHEDTNQGLSTMQKLLLILGKWRASYHAGHGVGLAAVSDGTAAVVESTK